MEPIFLISISATKSGVAVIIFALKVIFVWQKSFQVSLLKNYSERKVNKIVDAMQVEEFLDGDCITRWVDFIDLNIGHLTRGHYLRMEFRQGSFGETFYIILDGEVEVSLKQKGFIRTMVGGDYFGEMALLNEAALR